MRKHILLLSIVALTAPSLLAAPEPGPAKEDPAAHAALQNYLDSAPSTAKWMRDVSMEVSIDASLPRLKKTGKLEALRKISNIGKITYIVRAFKGDNTVKKEVIGKYLEAEAKAAEAARLRDQAESHRSAVAETREEIEERRRHADRIDPKTQVRDDADQTDVRGDAVKYGDGHRDAPMQEAEAREAARRDAQRR